jgi:ribosome-binding protein aMBF1 (putative translation factor)
MANYTFGVRTICPYYIKEAEKSITCEGLIPHTVTMVRFASQREKVLHQRKHCEQYDAEKGCPIRAAIDKKIAQFGDSEQKFAGGELLKEFGCRVRDERKKRGYTQRSLAGMVYIEASYLCEIEQGKKRPSIDVAVLLAEALDVEISTLLGERKV